MKKLVSVAMLCALTLPAHAQRFLNSLQDYQKEIPPKNNSNNSSEVKVEPVNKTKTNGKCEEQIQISLPLNYVSSLILDPAGKLEINHDPRTGQLEIASSEMISNCSSMIDWSAKSRMIDGKVSYVVEAKIKSGDACDSDGCTYSVAKVEKNQFKAFEKIKFKSDMTGFEDCLEKTGVLKDGKVNAEAIYPSSVQEKFSGFKETGDLVFVSRGPMSPVIKGKYDKFIEIDKCAHYEKILPEGFLVKSLADIENEQIEQEKAKVETCGDYQKISDFIEKYQDYANELNGIRDNLILEAAKKSAKAISEGKYTEDDLKTLADFEKYILQPRIDRANQLYQQASEQNGDNKKIVMDELKKVLSEISSFNQAPYITAAIVQKLEADGRFEDALKINSMKVNMVVNSRLGQTENGVVITPDTAKLKIASMNQAYSDEVEKKKETYQIKTGQVSGYADTYSQLANRMRQNIQIRSQNFSEEISAEYNRIRPGGFCYRPYRNTQRCIMDAQMRIQELQAQLQHFNKVDAERAAEYDQKATEYAALEREGRIYVARQNGETVPEEPPTDTTVPGPRNNQPYNFDFQGYQDQQQYQQQQYQQQQYQQQYSPYMQNPMMNQYNQYNGYQTFGPQFNGGGNQWTGNYGYYNQGVNPYQQQGYGFNYQGYGQQQGYNPYQMSMFNGQNPYGMPQGFPQQQGSYWGSPYQAYGNYNMYGSFGR